MWKYYALLSAFCASLTALFSKLGVRDINSDLATAIRVSFILVLVWGIALASGAVRGIRDIAPRTLIFLLISAAATGLSWLFYFKALQVAMFPGSLPSTSSAFLSPFCFPFCCWESPPV